MDGFHFLNLQLRWGPSSGASGGDLSTVIRRCIDGCGYNKEEEEESIAVVFSHHTQWSLQVVHLSEMKVCTSHSAS